MSQKGHENEMEVRVQTRKYVVVEFVEEVDEDGMIPMAVVSSTWLQYEEDAVHCQWPSYLKTDRDRINAAVNHAKLDVAKCGSCPVNVKYKSIEYKRAMSKLKQLETLSSISQTSDTEDDILRKRHITKKTYDNFQNFSSDDEDVPVPPPLVRDLQAKSNTMSDFKKKSCFNGSTATNGAGKVASSISAASTPITLKRTVPTTSHTTNVDPPARTQCYSCKQTEDLIKRLFEKIDGLAKDVTYLTQIIQDSGVVDMTLRGNTVAEGLPVSTADQLYQLNSNLEESETMSTLCSSLQVVGGKDVIDTTRRVIGKILTNPLALTFNWSGRNDKKCFGDQKNILKLILIAVRKNPFSKNATQQEVESVIKVWLRNAHDRDGGRQKRAKEQSN